MMVGVKSLKWLFNVAEIDSEVGAATAENIVPDGLDRARDGHVR